MHDIDATLIDYFGYSEFELNELDSEQAENLLIELVSNRKNFTIKQRNEILEEAGLIPELCL